MEKSKSGTTQKSKKSTPASNSSTGAKSKKSNVANSDTSTGATSKAKSKVGHGMANEGTNGTYEDGNR